MTDADKKDMTHPNAPSTIDLGKSAGDVSPENLAFLRGLIDSFNTSTARLQAAYDTLRNKVESLNLELERKNADLSRSLAEQERLSNYLTNILESLSSGVLVVDSEGVITLFNSGAASITGVPVEDAVNRRYDEVMGGYIPAELTPLAICSSMGGHAQFEKTIMRRSGDAVPVGCSISPLLNASGAMIGAVEIFMDMSRIKSLEDELARKEKLAALGQMAATMAHKIRNPLGGIAGFAGLLGLECRDIPNGPRLVGKITEGVDKLERIVTSLLSYTAPMTLEYRTIDLMAELKGAATAFDLAGQPELCEIRCPDGMVMAEVDVERFRKALHAIIRNAREAVADGGRVALFAGDDTAGMGDNSPVTARLLARLKDESRNDPPRSGMAFVIVADTGAGMDTRTKEQMFVPFYTTKENGIGLGLAYAGKIIEAHRGRIVIESEEGWGTSVAIVIPKRRAT